MTLSKLILKIDIDTYHGTKKGALNLARQLLKLGAGATFLFSLGPDHTGLALKKIFQLDFLKKILRTSVIKHYNLKTLAYGTLLPAPDIGKRCGDIMRIIYNAGFECGIHTWDHRIWQDSIRIKNAKWTQQVMQKAYSRFHDIFGSIPSTHGAAGWQMNEHAFAQLDIFNIAYASDSRAVLKNDGTLHNFTSGPYRLIVQDKILSCIQLPTTLPTLDELLGTVINNVIINTNNITALLLSLTEKNRDHVFTLHAELEGQKLAFIFKQLLLGWKAQGYDFVSLNNYYQSIKNQVLPILPISWGKLPGRHGEVILQKL